MSTDVLDALSLLSADAPTPVPELDVPPSSTLRHISNENSTPVFQRITRLRTGVLPRRRFLTFKGRKDTFDDSLSLSNILRVSGGTDSTNHVDVMQVNLLCNEDDDSGVTEIPLDTDVNLRRNNRLGTSLFHAAVNHVSNLSDLNTKIPESFAQARQSLQWEQWKGACLTEMAAHLENGTFDAVPCPEGVKPIGCRWVFTIKDSGLYKARLVAKGFTQVKRIDFNETFSPVIKHTSIRLMFAIAVKHGMEVHAADFNSAFLNSQLNEDIYMRQPPGYPIEPRTRTTGVDYVLKLNKSLYGLKQAPLMWNETINAELTQQGFHRTVNDTCLYSKGKNDSSLIVALYVDDLLILGKDSNEIGKVKESLGKRFKMKDLGLVLKFLGINVELGENYIKLHLEDYIDSLLKNYNMEECSPHRIPAVNSKSNTVDDDQDYPDGSEYRSIVGKLRYAANTVRFDISHIVLKLSRHLANPKVKHMVEAKRVLRYLKGSSSFGLVYEHGNHADLTAYCDADFAADVETHSRSITGAIILYGGSPVCWKSKLQTMVALSTVNAELVALCYTSAEVVWVDNLLEELGFYPKCQILCDNQGAVKTVKNGSVLDGTKHIRVKADFIKILVDMGKFELDYVHASQNVADIFTKALPYPIFSQLRLKGNLKATPSKGSVEE